MNWYRKIKISSKKSIVDIVYEDWKESSFEDNVNSVIQRIYQIGIPPTANKEKLSKRVNEVIKELANEDGEMQLWHKVIKDRKYFEKIKNSVKKNYKRKIKELERAKRGPLQINTPQTPDSDSGLGGGSGGMLM